MNAGDALAELFVVLSQLRQLLPNDKGVWDRQPVLRLAVERIWITACNLAEAYRIEQGIASGVEPWSELVGYRHLLARALPGDISSDRVFADGAADLDRILTEISNRAR